MKGKYIASNAYRTDYLKLERALLCVDDMLRLTYYGMQCQTVDIKLLLHVRGI
jgi:hypothetical protein